MKFLPLFLLLPWLVLGGCGDDDPTSTDMRELSLGAIFPLSGQIAEFGASSEAAMMLAVQDINQASEEVEVRPVLVYDTHSDNDSALAGLTWLKGEDRSVILGPLSSAELEYVKSYADMEDLLLLSPSSIAPSLSIEGDNIFRFAPDGTLQAKAMTAMLLEDDLEVVFTLYRDDVWGENLSSVAMSDYLNGGGKEFRTISYSVDDTDFTTLLGDLEEDVVEAISLHGPDKVGIYLLSFSEGVDMLSQAADFTELAKVKWYGASAVALLPSFTTNIKAAEFAASVGYPCPTFGLDESLKDRWEPLKARIKAVTGQEADIYSLVTYDVVHLAVKTFLATGSDDVEAFKAKLPEVAADYTGVTGLMELNVAGDRKTGNYDFWAIRKNSGTYEWEQVAFYNSGTKELTRK